MFLPSSYALLRRNGCCTSRINAAKTAFGKAQCNIPHELLKHDSFESLRSYNSINNGAGQLFYDRDYHVHLGGAVPNWLVKQWIERGLLSTEDVIEDLVAASRFGHASMIKIKDALVKYRGYPADTYISKTEYLSAYNKPTYTSLSTFLTMYRAYSKRHLLYEYASTIAKGDFMNPCADVRVSLPVPNSVPGNGTKESSYEYATRAIKEMIHFHDSLLPTQQLFITIPRQTFNKDQNQEYFNSFLDMLSEQIEDQQLTSTAHPLLTNQQPSFDFAGQPLPLSKTKELLSKLRTTFPSGFICYHHGELCDIPFNDRVNDTFELLPYVNRVGHGLCLGLAVLDLYPGENGYLKDASTVDGVKGNRDIALQCLHEMAELNIGIEVTPTCNITLGGASDANILKRYVDTFLEAGVNVYVGTDDPGFLNTTLEKELNILCST